MMKSHVLMSFFLQAVYFLSFKLIYLVGVGGTHVEVREQLVWASLLFLLCAVRVLNLVNQAWQQAPLFGKPSGRPSCRLLLSQGQGA